MEALETFPASPDTPAPLVRAACAGDRQAYGRLVEEHWGSLVRLARSVVGDAEAEDVVQDALVHAWKKLRSLRDPERFSAWISRLVTRVCLRRHRGWLRRPTLSLTEVSPTDLPPKSSDHPNARIDLQRSLEVLAPRQRVVLHWTVVEGMSDSEIAERMGITAASVRSHRRRARQRLAKLWKETEA